MARTAASASTFITVRSEGGLLPPDLLARIAFVFCLGVGVAKLLVLVRLYLELLRGVPAVKTEYGGEIGEGGRIEISSFLPPRSERRSFVKGESMVSSSTKDECVTASACESTALSFA